MSGLKEGHFKAAVGRLLENASRYKELARNNTARFSRIPGVASGISGLLGALSGLSGMSAAAREFAPDECRRLAEEIEALRNRLDECSQQDSRACKLRQEAERCQGDSDAILGDLEKKLEQIWNRAQHKVRTTAWIRLALDKEVAEVNALAAGLEKRVAQTEHQAAEMLSQARDLEVSVQSGLSVLETAFARISSRRALTEALARQRSEAHKISEARKKASVQSNEEIKAFAGEISKTEHERFMPGIFGGLNERIARFDEHFSRADYEECSAVGAALVEDLKKYHEELSGVIRAFQEAEKRALGALEAAREEVASLDLEELARWSQKGPEVQAAVASLQKSGEEIERISAGGSRAAEFDAPARNIVSVLSSLRELSNLATDNHARYDARDGIRRAIRDALQELKYDKPEYYFQETLPDGSCDELSDLTIYAHNPSGVGNMRLKVNLDGGVAFEIFREDEAGNELEEVTRQDAVACHGALTEFGRCLESAGITLHVTDWGKAKDLPEAQEQGRITWDDADPEKKGQTAQRVQIGQQTKEQQKERENRKS